MGAIGRDEAVTHHLLRVLAEQRHAGSRVVMKGGMHQLADAVQLDTMAAAALHHRVLHPGARPGLHAQPVLPTPHQLAAHQRRLAPAHPHAIAHGVTHHRVPHLRAHTQRQALHGPRDERSINHRPPAPPHPDAVPGAPRALGRSQLHRVCLGALHHQGAVDNELHPPRVRPGAQRIVRGGEHTHSRFDDQLGAPAHRHVSREQVGAPTLLPHRPRGQHALDVRRRGRHRQKAQPQHQQRDQHTAHGPHGCAPRTRRATRDTRVARKATVTTL